MSVRSPISNPALVGCRVHAHTISSRGAPQNDLGTCCTHTHMQCEAHIHTAQYKGRMHTHHTHIHIHSTHIIHQTRTVRVQRTLKACFGCRVNKTTTKRSRESMTKHFFELYSETSLGVCTAVCVLSKHSVAPSIPRRASCERNCSRLTNREESFSEGFAGFTEGKAAASKHTGVYIYMYYSISTCRPHYVHICTLKYCKTHHKIGPTNNYSSLQLLKMRVSEEKQTHFRISSVDVETHGGRVHWEREADPLVPSCSSPVMPAAAPASHRPRRGRTSFLRASGGSVCLPLGVPLSQTCREGRGGGGGGGGLESAHTGVCMCVCARV